VERQDDLAHRPTRSRLGLALLALGAVALLVRVLLEGWIGEDALITFRTIDNFINGYGLRWNVDERVQTYTHPLWLFVNTLPYAITKEVPWTLATVCLACSFGAYFVVARRLLARPRLLFFGLVLPLIASQTLVYYGTSGFETPLGFLLLALLAATLFPADREQPTRWGWIAVFAALAMTNRLDYALLVAPACVWAALAEWRSVRWGRVVLGALPLLTWLAFAVLYYGFPVPNTAPAKLSDEIGVGEYVREGIIYTAEMFRWDPISVPILVAALFVAVAAARRVLAGSGDRADGRLAALAAGIFLYGGYIVSIGGGFLSGRFWAPALFAGILVVVFGVEGFLEQLRAASAGPRRAVTAGVVLLLVAACVFGWGLAPREGRGPILARSVAHYRLGWDFAWHETELAVQWTAAGIKQRTIAEEEPDVQRVVPFSVIGFMGLSAGPEVIVLDRYGLADPLMARLPIDPDEEWRIGHLKRAIPPGYREARRTGSTKRMPSGLKEYYDALRLIVSGPIFDVERLKTIVGFNLGRYDHLLEGAQLRDQDRRRNPRDDEVEDEDR